jgi:hypothetical protein
LRFLLGDLVRVRVRVLVRVRVADAGRVFVRLALGVLDTTGRRDLDAEAAGVSVWLAVGVATDDGVPTRLPVPLALAVALDEGVPVSLGEGEGVPLGEPEPVALVRGCVAALVALPVVVLKLVRVTLRELGGVPVSGVPTSLKPREVCVKLAVPGPAGGPVAAAEAGAVTLCVELGVCV